MILAMVRLRSIGFLSQVVRCYIEESLAGTSKHSCMLKHICQWKVRQSCDLHFTWIYYLCYVIGTSARTRSKKSSITVPTEQHKGRVCSQWGRFNRFHLDVTALLYFSTWCGNRSSISRCHKAEKRLTVWRISCFSILKKVNHRGNFLLNAENFEILTSNAFFSWVSILKKFG